MDYHEAVESVLAIPRYKKKTDQLAIAHLLALLGNPQQSFSTIQVVGTNGKGSICAYLDEIGRSLKYRMGLFTSPHLLDIRERFRVDGELVKTGAFAALYERVSAADALAQREGYAPATFFEMIFAMAMCHFADCNVDFAVVEAGMGGGSDTTNVLMPELAVIASVGLDHTAILGDTIEAIAREKAGVMKPNVPVAASAQTPLVRAIFCQMAESVGTTCRFADEYDARILKNTLYGIDFSVENRYDKESLEASRETIHIGLCGEVQVANACTAMLAAQLLWGCRLEQLVKPLADTKWAGRLEEVAERIFVDGAHNPQAMEALAKAVNGYMSDAPLTILYAVASDKDDAAMLPFLLAMHPVRIVVTELANARKTPAEQVRQMLFALDETVAVDVICDLQQAIQTVVQQRTGDARVLCVGSLYLVSEVKASLGKRETE